MTWLVSDDAFEGRENADCYAGIALNGYAAGNHVVATSVFAFTRWIAWRSSFVSPTNVNVGWTMGVLKRQCFASMPHIMSTFLPAIASCAWVLIFGARIRLTNRACLVSATTC